MATTSAPSFTPTASGPVAAVRSLRKSYQGKRAALDGIDLDVERAAITALTGPNGSGKTTLLRILAGRLAPDSGTVTVLGVDPGVDSPWLRSHLGFVSQDIALDPEMTGAQLLKLFATLYGVPRRQLAARIERLTQSLELARHLEMRVSAYSGGLRRRLHLALGLLHEPQLLLLDEPTAGLDPAGRAFLWSLLKSLAEGSASIVVITHDLGEVERHCQRAAVLGEGKLLGYGSPVDLVRAHARRTVKVALAASPPASDPLFAELGALPGVKAVRGHGFELSIDIVEEHPARERILAMLSERGLDVRSFQVEAPDLASAYFQLTGVAVEQHERPARGPGLRGQRRSKNREAS